MAFPAVHGLFDIQHASSTPTTSEGDVGSTVNTPPPTHQQSRTQARHKPSVLELDEFTFGTPTPAKNSTAPRAASGHQRQPSETSQAAIASETEHGPTPNELEMSRPASPINAGSVNIIQSWNNPPINKWRVLSACLCYFVNGMNDSATGALIPYMETHYTIGYAIVSMIFVGQAAGFIIAAFFNNVILRKLGRAKMLMLAEALMVAAYVMLVCTPPYPVVVIAFFLIGYGEAITLALNNVFTANLQNSSAVCGAAHGSYGIGGIIAPIVATVLCSGGTLWSRFFFMPFGLALLSMTFAGWAFRGYVEDGAMPASQTLIDRGASSQTGETGKKESRFGDLKMALKSRATIFGALFIFAYQGAEVAISGWVISFLINYRGGDPGSVGYVTAGFWAGITLGRFLLTHAAPYFGERIFVLMLIAGSVAFQLLAWLVPSIITNAVAVGILGLLLGPVYPCSQTILAKLWPRNIQTSAMGFIAGAGSSGGAVAPFTTGILAQAVGTYVLHPICLGLYAVMVGCWLALPKVRKRTE